MIFILYIYKWLIIILLKDKLKSLVSNYNTLKALKLNDLSAFVFSVEIKITYTCVACNFVNSLLKCSLYFNYNDIMKFN